MRVLVRVRTRREGELAQYEGVLGTSCGLRSRHSSGGAAEQPQYVFDRGEQPRGASVEKARRDRPLF